MATQHAMSRKDTLSLLIAQEHQLAHQLSSSSPQQAGARNIGDHQALNGRCICCWLLIQRLRDGECVPAADKQQS